MMIVWIKRRGVFCCHEHVVLNKRQIAICFAPRKYEVKEAIAELRRSKQLPFKNGSYKPNYEGIKNVYVINAARLLKLDEKGKRGNKVDGSEPDDGINTGAIVNIKNAAMMSEPPVDIVSNLYVNMLKEIILCDYQHVGYDPTNDDLLSSVTITKKRRKLISLKGLVTVDPATLDEIRMYGPNDDEEERKERRKLHQIMIKEERERMIYEETEFYPALERQTEKEIETQIQIDDLSILSANQQVIEAQERFDKIKLGLKIANIVMCLERPECGITYKKLAFRLFPEATKSDKELESCIQTIVRAIDTVQIHVLTRCISRKATIRIFPIALPTPKVGQLSERVFNGYRRKYIDKVLSEFIIRR